MVYVIEKDFCFSDISAKVTAVCLHLCRWTWAKCMIFLQVEKTVMPKGLESTLILLDTVKREDSGPVECIAKNDFGRNQTQIDFVVQAGLESPIFFCVPLGQLENFWTLQEVPETPEKFSLVSHSSRQANLSWSRPYDGNSLLLAFHLEFHRPNAGKSDITV